MKKILNSLNIKLICDTMKFNYNIVLNTCKNFIRRILKYDIVLKDENAPEIFIRELSDLDGISEISLVASKHDVDY